MAQLTNEQCGEILGMFKTDRSQVAIAKSMGVHQSTISSVLKKHRDWGLLGHVGGNGRPVSINGELGKKHLN
jgi:transposase